MNTMIKAEKQNGEETVRYEEDGQYTIPYQKRMLRLRMKEHTAGMEEKDGRLCYRIREGETLRTFWTGVKRPADVIRACVPYARPFSRFEIDRGNIGKNGRFCPVSLTLV